eukprot:IDg2866t1
MAPPTAQRVQNTYSFAVQLVLDKGSYNAAIAETRRVKKANRYLCNNSSESTAPRNYAIERRRKSDVETNETNWEIRFCSSFAFRSAYCGDEASCQSLRYQRC